MTLRQAVERRLMDIRSIFQESGVTEMTGKLRYHAGTREVSGRIGGAKKAFPELSTVSQSPKIIARAIERGKGKVFRQVYGAVERGMLKAGYLPPRKRGRLSVEPHRGKRYCTHCRELHTKGEHRFHGKGAFDRTHLFSFNPRMRKKRNSIGRTGRTQRQILAEMRQRYVLELTTAELIQKLQSGKYTKGFEKAARAEILRRGVLLPYSQRNLIKRNRVRLGSSGGARRRASRRARKNPPMTRIYGKVLRIEAQKTGKHICDSACKKAGHRYYHDFKVKPSMFGLSDGSLLIKK